MTPICKGRDGSARLVSGVHAREQRAASSEAAIREKRGHARGHLRVSRAFVD